MRSTRLRAALVATASACAGCMPILAQVYIPEAPAGILIYSSCTFNTHVPVGISVAIQDVQATVILSKHDGREYVQVQFDVPTGKTLILDSGAVRLDMSDPQHSTRGEFPSVSLIDYPIVNSYGSALATQQYQLPVTAPLVGGHTVAGTTSWSKHFWLAAYVDTASSSDILMTLPGFTLNGIQSHLPPIHFHRQAIVEVALFNC